MSSKTVYSVALQQHVRYTQVTVAELKDGDIFVNYYSDITEDDYRLKAITRNSRGELWAASNLLGDNFTTAFKCVLTPDTHVYKIL